MCVLLSTQTRQRRMPRVRVSSKPSLNPRRICLESRTVPRAVEVEPGHHRGVESRRFESRFVGAQTQAPKSGWLGDAGAALTASGTKVRWSISRKPGSRLVYTKGRLNIY
jgi:hypothetical protein